MSQHLTTRGTPWRLAALAARQPATAFSRRGHGHPSAPGRTDLAQA
ncbi:hypothetical protein [Actinokineospora cianjurensis]|nr:hypothetical protein [Actinokineospora cianjurensis]